uniref:Sulfotransferase domain-containing protein n=1 Tax=Eucampia antarctica TaxID=49252 RepID=A0A7S2S6T4_9STRA|mmetsp:Transcript_3845/g.3612  ORF Transcript_3845/g.3612 Transcript_3845/m.3612 type:complete len:201 (+) Transcript_3845:3-605(+)
MFRNVYDWSRAMIATPHHAPAHMDLSWDDFLTKPWTMERTGADLSMSKEEMEKPHFCQQKFQYKDVNSCHIRPYPKNHFNKTRFSEHQPFYEMRNDGSGEPYNNMLELRSDKIKHFLSLKDFKNVEDLWVVQYEDLLQYGTKDILHILEKLTGVQANCKRSPPQTNRKKREILPKMIKYLNEHVDWQIEHSIGYEQKPLS